MNTDLGEHPGQTTGSPLTALQLPTGQLVATVLCTYNHDSGKQHQLKNLLENLSSFKTGSPQITCELSDESLSISLFFGNSQHTSTINVLQLMVQAT